MYVCLYLGVVESSLLELAVHYSHSQVGSHPALLFRQTRLLRHSCSSLATFRFVASAIRVMIFMTTSSYFATSVFIFCPLGGTFGATRLWVPPLL